MSHNYLYIGLLTVTLLIYLVLRKRNIYSGSMTKYIRLIVLLLGIGVLVFQTIQSFSWVKFMVCIMAVLVVGYIIKNYILSKDES